MMVKMSLTPDRTVLYKIQSRNTVPLEQTPFAQRSGEIDTARAAQTLGYTTHVGTQKGLGITLPQHPTYIGGSSVIYSIGHLYKCSVPEEPAWIGRKFEDSLIAEWCREEAIMTYLANREKPRIAKEYDYRYPSLFRTYFPEIPLMDISTVRGPEGQELLFAYISIQNKGYTLDVHLQRFKTLQSEVERSNNRSSRDRMTEAEVERMVELRMQTEKIIIARECIEALAQLHNYNVVHGDLKPSSFCISLEKKVLAGYPTEIVRRMTMIDFGNARLVGDARLQLSEGRLKWWESVVSKKANGQPDLEQFRVNATLLNNAAVQLGLPAGTESKDFFVKAEPSQLKGTPIYSAPEARLNTPGYKHDYRSDVYSLGLTIFESITGKAVADIFDKPDVLKQTIVDTLMQEAKGSRYLEIVAQVVGACLEPEADNRPQSGEALLQLYKQLSDARLQRDSGYSGPTTRL
jgi:hypothetical protein